ncbi:MAG: histidine kinase [Cytophagaceae bacterium]|nr:histidine kinase [Cytophagaceae bacterium]MDW8456243.1 histidine kinase [Cytophagaceae bacterium]
MLRIPLNITFKLTAVYLLLGFFFTAVLSYIFYHTLKNSVIERAMHQLSSVNMLKKNTIENYFSYRKINQLYLQSNEEFVQTILDKNDLLHKKNIEDYLEKFHYRNALIFDNNFDKVFNSFDSTFLTHVLNDATSKETLFSFIRNTKDYHIIDFTRYNPTGETMLLVSFAIKSKEGKPLGWLLLEKDFSYIQEILLERTGLGNTGETYLVAEDFTMRSPSRFFPDSVPSHMRVHTKASIEISNNREGESILDDYRGIPVLSVYRKLNIAGIQWAIISEIDVEEALIPVYSMRDKIIIVLIAISTITLVVTYLVSIGITKPVRQLRNHIILLSKGQLPPKQHVKSNPDEIGQMIQAMNQLIDVIQRTREFATAIGHGNFDAEYTALSKEDVLGNALLQMRDKLKEIQKYEREILRQRSSAIIEGQEKERGRIARELHDGISQMLTALRFQLEITSLRAEEKAPLKQLIDETIAEVKRISQSSMPAALVDFGLEAALRTICDNVSRTTHTKIDFFFDESIKADGLSFEINVCLYRIAQEAINNTLKHAEASKISIEVSKKHNHIEMKIRDNGKGFDENNLSNPAGSGLKNIRERTALLNGQSIIKSDKSKGTEIIVTLPIVEHQEIHSPL